MPDADSAFGPDISFDPRGNDTCEFWALVSATDGSGIAVANVRTGDRFQIIDASGVCSFSKGRAKLVRSIVAVAPVPAGRFTGTGPWKKVTDSMRAELDKHADDDSGRTKRRDAFGHEIGGGGSVAQEEGGLIVCLPPATGMVYSNGKVRRGDDKKKPPVGASFLLRGTRPQEIIADGVIRIGVFDSNFKDNAGCYEIKFSLMRPVPAS